MIEAITTREPLPAFTAWTIDSDLAEELVALILSVHPKHVLECGSGISSLLIGYALEKNGAGFCRALEHDAKYASQTHDAVLKHGLEEWVGVHHAPIVNVPIDDGAYPWYSAEHVSANNLYDFVFIDGPPGSTGPLARWPALPIVLPHCTPECVFVLDDTNRPGEAAAVADWLKRYPHLKATSLSARRGATVLAPGLEAKTAA